ncbi:hypothetical protein NBRC116188_28710 [Oceaniserpentilla sp. 4NH20-0058]|uniref:hypothetical protein n=1 Tax=Oceaniserpentilla sp. 4NH20-0058 TaxID=3127660 RepID=UPI0031082098
MDLRKALISSLLISSPAFAAVENNIIQSEEAVSTTLAGRIGEAAIFAVQADDDDTAEIFATASSNIDELNDHWLLLNWTGSDYEVVERGNLQSSSQQYTSAYQVDFSKIILGHEQGIITTIEFTDDASASDHIITETSVSLTDLPNNVDIDLIHNIKAIVPLQGTDTNDYIAICTVAYIHILEGNALIASENVGGYCQSGNIDYETLASDPNTYDQELVTQDGLYFNFDGVNWVQKFLVSSELGDNFKLANIDDDDADEILSQLVGQIQVFSPLTVGSWLYISALTNANLMFNTFDIDSDGIDEIFFDYQDTNAIPVQRYLNQVQWNTVADTHRRVASLNVDYALTNAHYLPTSLAAGTASAYQVFFSNNAETDPQQAILHTADPSTLATTWSGLTATAQRSAETLVKTASSNTINDYKIAQLEQDEFDHLFLIKYFDSINLQLESSLIPDFADDEINEISSISAYDFSDDGIDELHFGGSANYTVSLGVVLSSNLDGTDYARLDTPFITEVSSLFAGNINNSGSADIMATGPDVNGNGIGFHSQLDSAAERDFWFAPGSGDINFNYMIAANIKGTDEPEILGLHTQLASVDLNAGFLDSLVYNLSNLAFDHFTTISLHDRDYDYAFTADSTGTLYFIEPKDFDILATNDVCNGSINGLHTLTLNNNLNAIAAICDQTLMSWILEYETDNLDHGYSLYPLASYDLGNLDTSETQLISKTTDDDNLHLFLLAKNQYKRFLIDKTISEDSDSDGYVNYKDAFPAVISQWEDLDLDGLGDNQAGDNPDPSLNDIDNDGILDEVDVDNQPENDLDPSNDSDQGNPSFVGSLAVVTASSISEETLVSLARPDVADVFDDYYGHGPLTVNGSVNNTPLVVNDDEFEATLTPGAHSVIWNVTDLAGNSAFTTQSVQVYPQIQFSQTTTTIGETQTAVIEVSLSGESPVYPFDVQVEVTAGSAVNSDIAENINTPITVTFESGQTEQLIQLTAINDNVEESDETLSLSFIDAFDADTWTINPEQDNHTLQIIDVNQAPTISFTVEQGGVINSTPTNIGGAINLNASISDVNNSDTHTYSWNLTTLGLGTSLLEDVQFNPADIEPALYAVTLTVTDNGLPNLATTETLLINLIYGDSDGDGVADDVDAFPSNPLESSDRDGDGVGDNSDVFPDDPSENQDSDNDGTGDNADPFDDDPTETQDSDNDGVGDNSDVFPDDPSEQVDTDGDGVGDNSDAFPDNADEQLDSDRDGTGDNSDAFPFNSSETLDTDEDGVGDNADIFPNDPSRSSRSTETDSEEDEEEGFGSSGSLGLFWILLILPLISIRRSKRAA